MIIIAGGYDKHIPFEPLAPYIIEKVKLLYLCGNTAEKIERCIREYSGYDGEPEIIRVDDIKQAVERAKAVAEKGDIVTLSPACASFDMFPNFAARGNYFKEVVNGL